MLKRIFLFLGLNILIISCVSILCDLLNVQPYISKAGLNIESLAIFCFIWGMAGSLIALLLSKKIAKWMLSVKIIDNFSSSSEIEQKLYSIVQNISSKGGIIKMPEVGIFKSSQANAFATGSTKNSALIAVSSHLLETLSTSELEAVIAHEVAHIKNGDMVTMSLLQGVINAFVMFLSRICAFALSGMGGKDNRRSSGSSMSFFLFTILFEMLFLSLGSILIFYVSRKREFAADKEGALLVGKEKMIAALQALKNSVTLPKKDLEKQKSFAAMMIRSTKPSKLSKLFSTHPTIEERITNLQALNDHLWNAESHLTDTF